MARPSTVGLGSIVPQSNLALEIVEDSCSRHDTIEPLEKFPKSPDGDYHGPQIGSRCLGQCTIGETHTKRGALNSDLTYRLQKNAKKAREEEVDGQEMERKSY
ncbi:hypothetical protein HBI23_032910 [Parastagonospora nodorum]|nr:hypothetical protein HBH49_022090 [Parastagonospora nodorum]KAH4606454.1 hypothetical protein HBH82_106570 [Parastagonospora nodorum]KAH4713077.1 hypothetical protein HBH67_009890 [Parastagonospora nodorum]KAH4728192.1 hypothetical protein HBH78_013180 [Parastagonospora nodorum]KAH4792067.1 hypothetical protein HBH62_025090 [Parastagonospora nodorum]